MTKGKVTYEENNEGFFSDYRILHRNIMEDLQKIFYNTNYFKYCLPDCSVCSNCVYTVTDKDCCTIKYVKLFCQIFL